MKEIVRLIIKHKYIAMRRLSVFCGRRYSFFRDSPLNSIYLIYIRYYGGK